MKRKAFSPHDDIYIQYLRNMEKHDMPVQHYHDGYEIFLMLGGKRYLFYDNICFTLERGDMAVLRPFDIHYAQSRDAEYYERFVLNFSETALSALLSREELRLLREKLVPCVVHLNEEQTELMLDFFKRVNGYFEKSGFLSEKLQHTALIQLVMYVVECTQGEQTVGGRQIPAQIRTELTYINQHYRENPGLEEIAGACNVNKYHLCHTFKEITGATVLEYLNNVRLSKAHSLLMDTGYSMEEIARETGFSSSLNLTRVFKKAYGMAPTQFRKRKESMR